MGIGSNEISTLHTYLNHFAYKIFNENEKSIKIIPTGKIPWKLFRTVWSWRRKASFDHYKKQLIDSNIIKKFNEDRFLTIITLCIFLQPSILQKIYLSHRLKVLWKVNRKYRYRTKCKCLNIFISSIKR